MRVQWITITILSLLILCTDITVNAAILRSSSSAAQDEQQRLVEGVEFRGNRRIPTDTIRLKVLTREGDLYNPEQVQRDYQAILAEGFFDEFESKVSVEDGPRGGIIVVFVLRERPIIRDIQYEGLKSAQVSDVITRYREKRITLTKDSQLDPVQVKRAEGELKGLLSEKGRPDATVKAEVENISATTVVVVFNVDEGPRVRVMKIDFEGNQVFSARQLRRAMKLTKQSSLFTRFTSKDVYSPEKFSDDVIRVRQLLFENGYLRPTIGEAKIEDLGIVGSSIPIIGKKSRGLKITLPVEEGILYKFGEIKVDGATVFTPEQVIQISGLKTGDVASGKTIREGIFERLKKAYGSQGYIQAETNLDQNFHPIATGSKEGIVDFTITVEEGSVFQVRQIEFLGNSVTRDQVLRREFLINEGEPYNQELLEYSILRLNQLGFFEEIKKDTDVQTQTDERNKQVDLTVRVKEKGRQQIQFTGGISGIGGSFIGITYSTNNLFGYGQSATIDVQTGNRQRNISFAYTEPYLLGKPISLGVSIYNSRLNFVQGIAASGQPLTTGNNFFGQSGATLFTQATTGGSVSMSAPLGVFVNRFPKVARFTRVGLSYSYSSTKIIDPEVNRDADKNNDILLTFAQPGITASTITPSFVYNTLNKALDPTDGKNLSFSFGFSGLGGKVKTIAPSFEYKEFMPFHFLSQGKDKPAVLGMRFLAQHISSFGTPLDLNSSSFIGGVPIYSRFFIGGETSIRGYNIRSISPVAEVLSFFSTSNVSAIDIITGKPVKVLAPDKSIRGIAQSVLDSYTAKDKLVVDPRCPSGCFTQIGGDTQLLLNLEYRIPIVGPFSMAFFADGGSAFNVTKMKDQAIRSNFIPNTSLDIKVLNPQGLIATQKEIDDARTPETPSGSLPAGFRSVFIKGDQARADNIILSKNLGSLSRNFRASIGAEIRVQVPVLQVPFRLIFAYNPNARTDSKDPRQLAIEQKTTIRFSIGPTF